jgi:serine/threonine protein kinase/CheY-like chemotaxis protein
MTGPRSPGGAAARDEPAPERGSILVVDDEPALLRATVRQLRNADYTVTACSDGTSAAAMLVTDAFDVVVSDIEMPGLTGVDLLKLLRQRGLDVPVILMTGAPGLDTAMLAVEHGAFKYVAKPIGAPELLEVVERAMRRRSGVASRSERGSASPMTPASTTRAEIAPDLVLANRYRLAHLLGEGGMSQVWEAVHMLTGRPVAVKLLLPALNARSEMRKRLLREARAASSVSHPNVVDVFDVFELGDGTPVMVTELLRGRTLGDRLAREGTLSLEEAADVVLPVVSAVGAAHAQGVIHRDLKPDNIFLVRDGERTSVKVLDFGIVKLVTGEERDAGALTATGALIGTPGYMAPEQGFGERDVDHRADVWSIGAILYETLSGVRPVGGDNIGQMLKQLVTHGIVPLSTRRPALPSSISGIVDRMLARERSDRPLDLREVHAELARHARTVAPGFGPPGIMKPPPSSGTMPASDVTLAHARTALDETPPPGRSPSAAPVEAGDVHGLTRDQYLR